MNSVVVGERRPVIFVWGGLDGDPSVDFSVPVGRLNDTSCYITAARLRFECTR